MECSWKLEPPRGKPYSIEKALDEAIDKERSARGALRSITITGPCRVPETISKFQRNRSVQAADLCAKTSNSSPSVESIPPGLFVSAAIKLSSNGLEPNTGACNPALGM